MPGYKAVVNPLPKPLDYVNRDSGSAVDTSDFLRISQNLADLSDAALARNNLGLGTLATLNSIDISSNTNLAVTSPITLTGDTIGLDQSAISHNSLGGLQGGTTAEYYHLTNTQHSRLSPVSAFIATLIPTANQLAAQIILGVVPGSDVQINDATLTALAGLTITANSLIVGTGADAFSVTSFAANTFPARASTGNLVAKTITDFALTLMDDATAADARTTLGLISGGSGDIWVELAGDTMTGTLTIDIPSDASAIKIVQNATQTTFPIQIRNSADTAYTSAIDGNGRFRSVASTSSGIAWMSGDLSATTYLTINHTSVAAALTNSTGNFTINSPDASTIDVNSNQGTMTFRVRGDSETNLLAVGGATFDGVAIGNSVQSNERLHVTYSSSSTSNAYGLRLLVTQTVSAAATMRAMQLNASTSHTSGTLTGLTVLEMITTVSGSGGTTSTVENYALNGSIGTGHTVTNWRYIHLYNPTVSGTLSNALEMIRIDDPSNATGAYAIRAFGGLVVFNDSAVQTADFRIEGQSLSHMFYTDADGSSENIALLTTAVPNWQSMDRGIFIGNATTVPTGNPTSGGFLYAESGALKYRGSGGTITTVGPA